MHCLTPPFSWGKSRLWWFFQSPDLRQGHGNSSLPAVLPAALGKTTTAPTAVLAESMPLWQPSVLSGLSAHRAGNGFTVASSAPPTGIAVRMVFRGADSARPDGGSTGVSRDRPGHVGASVFVFWMATSWGAGSDTPPSPRPPSLYPAAAVAAAAAAKDDDRAGLPTPEAELHAPREAILEGRRVDNFFLFRGLLASMLVLACRRVPTATQQQRRLRRTCRIAAG